MTGGGWPVSRRTAPLMMPPAAHDRVRNRQQPRREPSGQTVARRQIDVPAWIAVRQHHDGFTWMVWRGYLPAVVSMSFSVGKPAWPVTAVSLRLATRPAPGEGTPSQTGPASRRLEQPLRQDTPPAAPRPGRRTCRRRQAWTNWFIMSNLAIRSNILMNPAAGSRWKQMNSSPASSSIACRHGGPALGDHADSVVEAVAAPQDQRAVVALRGGQPHMGVFRRSPDCRPRRPRRNRRRRTPRWRPAARPTPSGALPSAPGTRASCDPNAPARCGSDGRPYRCRLSSSRRPHRLPTARGRAPPGPSTAMLAVPSLNPIRLRGVVLAP